MEQLRVPMHEWVYDIKTGKNLHNASKLSCYTVMERNDYVWMLLADGE